MMGRKQSPRHSALFVGPFVEDETYGAAHNYGQLNLQIEGANGQVRARQIKLGRIGSAFLGAVGGRNRARPPWSWFDRDERARPLGQWFFDPAQAVRPHLRGEPFSPAYLRHPLVPPPKTAARP